MSEFKRSVLGIDMDDVTADLTSKALDFYNRDNKENIITVNDLNNWDSNWNLMFNYYTNPLIYRDLELIEGAREVLMELNEKYKIVFITASPNIGSTVEKYNWIDRHFPEIGSSNVISTSHKYLINTDLLFDDSPSFIKDFKGHRILMDRIYNRHLTESDFDYRVNNWYEFNDIILDLENEGKLLY